MGFNNYMKNEKITLSRSAKPSYTDERERNFSFKGYENYKLLETFVPNPEDQIDQFLVDLEIVKTDNPAF